MNSAGDVVRVEMVGGTIVIAPVGDVNSFSAELLTEAAEMMTELIESHESPMLVIDLSGVPSCSRSLSTAPPRPAVGCMPHAVMKFVCSSA